MEINWKDGTTTKVVDGKIVTYEKELEYIKYNSHKTLPAMLKGFAKQRNTTPLSKINQDVYKEALRVVRLYQELKVYLNPLRCQGRVSLVDYTMYYVIIKRGFLGQIWKTLVGTVF